MKQLMKQATCFKNSSRSHNSGFALIASLAIMAVLVMIAVALYSMSNVATRTASLTKARAEAQANAKMAMMMAIGELQKEMGPDQRISANAAILDTAPDTHEIDDINHKHWLGVWDSWKAGGTTGSAHNTIQGVSDSNISPDYTQKKVNSSGGGYFRSWLVSLPEDDRTNIGSATDPTEPLVPSINPENDTNSVFLVHDGSLGDLSDSSSLNTSTDRVAARLIDVEGNGPSTPGRYAWWVGDQSQKATILADSYAPASSLTDSELIYRTQAPDKMGNEVLPGFENITDESQIGVLPTIETLNLISQNPQPNVDESSLSQLNFHHSAINNFSVLADVREGGLKRDLSILLERPIDITETGDEFMLYKFNTKDAWAHDTVEPVPDTPQEAVPIQDLAAYYQLYDDDPDGNRSRKGGLRYSGEMGDNLQASFPDFGADESSLSNMTNEFKREYTALYLSPVMVKFQFVMSVVAREITTDEKNDPENASLNSNDTHKLRIGVIPVITLWNPNNIPIYIREGDLSQYLRVKPPALIFQIKKTENGVTVYDDRTLNFAHAQSGGMTGGKADSQFDFLRLHFGRENGIQFKPGEVRIFSADFDGTQTTTYNAQKYDVVPGWDATAFIELMRSAPWNTNDKSHIVYSNTVGNRARWPMSVSFKASSSIEITIDAENTDSNNSNVGISTAPTGAGLHWSFIPNRIRDRNDYWYLRNYTFTTRFGGIVGMNSRDTVPTAEFTNPLLTQAMPGGESANPDGFVLAPISGSALINAGIAGQPLIQFAAVASSETSQNATSNVLPISGRKSPSRPFLHSSPIQDVFIDQLGIQAEYNHGWNLWIEEINSGLGAYVSTNPSNPELSFYGGGLADGNGTSYIIQQEIPVVPPISIGALSHAHLGGFSIANEAPAGEGYVGIENSERYNGGNQVDNPTEQKGFQRVTATGQGGLFPHILQAIGNSYAHPNLAADKAFDLNWIREYDKDDGERSVTFADHSYLANKALWDEFFFSSITPQREDIKPFVVSSNLSAEDVADQFFFGTDTTNSVPLPNRRIVPYLENLDQSSFRELFASAELLKYTNGTADKIASHLMVKGGFNVNSTSVNAWEAFLSSLRGKDVAYYDSGSDAKVAGPESPENTQIGSSLFPSDDAVTSSQTDPGDEEQWIERRELAPEEITALANAIVKQVKLRGPFLSLSEFINRRLDGENEALAVKGALQTAIDEAQINSAFYSNTSRSLDSEINLGDFAFDLAASGPVAYGSSAYVDQADILRNLGSQLTPRGDTFIIRAYGDTVDQSGKIIARAWCEATVQRVPEYVDPIDEAHLKVSALNPNFSTNLIYGRKYKILSFRWLDKDDV